MHPFARFDIFFKFTNKSKNFQKMIQSCTNFIQNLISNTKEDIANQNIQLENAKTFIQHLCCDTVKRPTPLTTDMIQNDLQVIIFAVSNDILVLIKIKMYNDQILFF